MRASLFGRISERKQRRKYPETESGDEEDEDVF